MPTRLLIFLVCSCLPLLTANVCAQTSPPSTQTMLTRFGAAPNGLARHDYLSSVLPSLDGNDKSLARQLLATVDSELGLYNEAVITFPFDNRHRSLKDLAIADYARVARGRCRRHDCRTKRAAPHCDGQRSASRRAHPPTYPGAVAAPLRAGLSLLRRGGYCPPAIRG